MAYMQVRVAGEVCRDVGQSSRLEWLLADGSGGYAMGTVSGINTRRYHGHWVPALNPPTDRWVLVDSLEAHAEVSGTSYPLSANQYPGALHPEGFRNLLAFEATQDFVRWTFDLGGNFLDKELRLMAGGARVTYTNGSKKPIKLSVRPLVCHKPYHGNFRAHDDYPVGLQVSEAAVSLDGPAPLVIAFGEAECRAVQGWYYRFERERERERGLDPLDDLFCPCELNATLAPDESWAVTLSGSSQPFDLAPRSESVFLVRSEVRTSILAGYPWFTDWGRDTMIALPGLCLASGQVPLARQILKDYASQLAEGLIPNRFVEGDDPPEYNTVDASLWFIRAVHLALCAEWHEAFAESMLISVQEIIDWYRLGTRFGIRMDAEDGLICQGGYDLQLTWMDARVDGRPITPRPGKPVEINGLWIHALRVLAWLNEQLGRDPKPELASAALAEASFHDRFWDGERGWYRDVVDPDDPTLRPNQVIALSLEFGPLEPIRAQRALQSIREHLVTAFGLRTKAPEADGFAPRFEGPLPRLDSAYHQGTVWPYLLGFYHLACRRAGITPDAPLDPAVMDEGGLGGIAEVFDATPPHRPGGCPWQAWSHAVLIEAGIVDSATVL